MKRSVTRLVSLVLLLALLTACGTDPASSSETTGGSTERQETAAQPPEEVPERAITVEELDLPDPPEQTAEERQAEFLAFLEEINAQRRAIYEAPDPPSFDGSWTPDLAALDGGFTREEMDRILTKRAAAAVSAEQAREDVETAFLLLKHCYGAYDYFGGDQVFMPLKEAALEALPESGSVTAEELEQILAEQLAPVLVDGHFRIGSTTMRDSHSKYMYSVTGLYFDDADGVDPSLVKPTIDDNGRLRLCLATLATPEEAESLPDTLTIQGTTVSLTWTRDTSLSRRGGNVFTESTVADGVPLLTSAAMYASTNEQQEQLERLANCGEEYADAPVLVLDVRGNGGGSDLYINRWFKGYTGQYPDRRIAWGIKFSEFNRHLYQTVGGHSADEIPETSQWANLVSVPGQFVKRDELTLVLQDKGTASAGETAVQNARALENTLIVGSNTKGSSLTLTNFPFYLPNSGLRLIFGIELCLTENGENLDGTGYPPDLWVSSGLAKSRVEDLIGYYDLAELFAE